MDLKGRIRGEESQALDWLAGIGLTSEDGGKGIRRKLAVPKQSGSHQD
jgi:hypothetical protein